MNQEAMLKPALVGGVALGVLSALPVVSAVNCLCCAWVIGGGILAANLYVKASPITVTLGRGVALGLLTGVIGAIVDTVFSVPLHMVLAGMGMGIAEQLREALGQVPNLPPETRDAVYSILSGEGSVGLLFIVLGGLIKLLIYGPMAMIGGAIGVAIFEKRSPGSGSAQAPPPPRASYEELPSPPPPPDGSRERGE